MTRALIIVAHGSSYEPETARIVSDHAAQLATRAAVTERFDDVEARFLKQEPLLTETPWRRWSEATVVPFFMADGWFVREVLPRKLGVDPFDDLPAKRRLRDCDLTITGPIGVAPELAGLVREMAREQTPGAHLVVVGHGTTRHARSTDSVGRVVARLRDDFPSVSARFVDDEPALDDTWSDETHADSDVVVVPYFAFPGPHVRVDIPEALGLEDASRGPHRVAGRTVWYLPPIGVRAEVVDVLEALVTGE